jgi:hypothetical protein
MPTEMGPWIDRLREHRLMVGAVAALVALAVALVWVAWRWGVAEDRMAMLQKQADAGFLLAPSSTRTVRIDLRNPGAVSIGGGDLPERVDFLLNARSDRYARFRLSVLREDGTLAFRVDQLVRDSYLDPAAGRVRAAHRGVWARWEAGALRPGKDESCGALNLGLGRPALQRPLDRVQQADAPIVDDIP